MALQATDVWIAASSRSAADRPASLEGIGNTVMPVVILIAIVLQWYYARRMAADGVLR